ncbi:hypothetical protein M3J09_009383 [Ascochyta lentis]
MTRQASRNRYNPTTLASAYLQLRPVPLHTPVASSTANI